MHTIKLKKFYFKFNNYDNKMTIIKQLFLLINCMSYNMY